MGWTVSAGLLACALGLLLLAAGIEDAHRREIANWKNAAIALLAPAWWWANGLALWPDVAVQVGIAALVFALFVGAFALGQMGGGDVKMIGAIALWLPFTKLAGMLMAMAVVGGLITLVLMIERRWRRDARPPEIPYGIAIAIGTLLAIREPVFNQIS